MKDREQAKELINYKKRLQVTVRAAGVCIFEVDINKQLYTYFENSEAIFGVSGEKILEDVRPYSTLPAEEYQKKVAAYFVHPEDTKAVNKAFDAIFKGKSASYTARMKAGESQYVWCKIDVSPVVEDGIFKMIGIISDIQEMYNKIQLLEKESYLDTFTRLYSKQRFEALCRSIFSGNTDKKMALIMMDLDNFKQVNDTYGHLVGDRVIQGVAAHLKRMFRKQDIIARFGGDEFVILMKDVPSVEIVTEKIEKFLQEADNEFNVTKSAGIALGTGASIDYDALLDRADQALYAAKKMKNTYVVK